MELMKLALTGNYLAKTILRECVERSETEVKIADSMYHLDFDTKKFVVSKLQDCVGADGVVFNKSFTRKERLTVYRALKADGIDFTVENRASNGKTYMSSCYVLVLTNKFN